MKAVFNLARILQPSVIFFDEIDALMSARKVRICRSVYRVEGSDGRVEEGVCCR